MYKRARRNIHGGLVVYSWLIDTNDRSLGSFLFEHTYYGHSKTYAFRIYDKIIKELGYTYAKE